MCLIEHPYKTNQTKKEYNIEQIYYMQILSKNWNSSNALPFTDDAIKQFINVVENIIIQPDIAPTVRNSMYFEYRIDNGSLLCFEIKENSVIQTYIPFINGKHNYDLTEEIVFNNNFIKNINNSLKKYIIKGDN